MKSTSMKSLFLFAASMGAIAIASAACSGGGGGSSTPTPTATPNPPNECDIIFFTPLATASHYNAYFVLMPASQWSNGTKTLSLASGDPSVDAVITEFLYDLDQSVTPSTFAVGGVATAGSFTLGNIPSTGATTQGAAFSFTATDNLKFFDIFQGHSGAQTGSNGMGTLASGTLSDPDPAAAPTTVDGSVTVNVTTMTMNSSLTIGGTSQAFGVCYDVNAFAPVSPRERALQLLKRVTH